MAGEAGALQLRVNFSLGCVSPLSPRLSLHTQEERSRLGHCCRGPGSVLASGAQERGSMHHSERTEKFSEGKKELLAKERRPENAMPRNDLGFLYIEEQARLARALDWVWGLSPTSFPFQESP